MCVCVCVCVCEYLLLSLSLSLYRQKLDQEELDAVLEACEMVSNELLLLSLHVVTYSVV